MIIYVVLMHFKLRLHHKLSSYQTSRFERCFSWIVTFEEHKAQANHLSHPDTSHWIVQCSVWARLGTDGR